ncbi:hypothetical protein MFMK1_002255 [Metallumcola ferriviriculae]|uniref:FAD/NAD(P)-binding domain-containing protein n=1 Tax=Metallumcola ferriviriculae TaxID=3039180 RepID=A0AAU0UQC1_9FIRM|nr:hypothetical protein MFMK1_002255 [Desulfitibacteraceae bacterium MK1]
MTKTLVAGLEKYLSKGLADHYRPLKDTLPNGLKDGSHVTVIGGGIAGSAFARQLASLAQEHDKSIKISMVNSTNCNYCGGLITNVALDTLSQMYKLEVPDNLVLKQVDECIYINQEGSVTVHLPHPLTATLRTSRFGLPGFDDSIKERITDGLSAETAANIEIIEPTLAKKVEKNNDGKHKWRVILSKRNSDNTNMVIDTDVVVIACGFRALKRPMLENFQHLTGYKPPQTIPASVTEVDTSGAIYNKIDNRMFILDGIIKDCVVAFVPKGPKWLTLTVLNRKLEKQDITELFQHPEVKKYIDLPDAANSLRCHTLCSAQVYTGASVNFYGDDWLIIGDLTGYGRILKDGYFAAFLGARLAAETLIYYGSDKRSLKKGYHKRLKHFPKDNLFGRHLFNINKRLQNQKWFSRYFIAAARSETDTEDGSWVHGALRALSTGELTYRAIAVFFTLGLIRYPFRLLAGKIGRGK